MCRKKETDTGRRCPSHTVPELIEARNEVRREQYAMKTARDKTAALLADAGVSFHRGDAVKDEYFQGEEDYSADKFEAIVDPTPAPVIEGLELKAFFQSKPADGGLWTSPGYAGEDGGIKTQWTDWTYTAGYKESDRPLSPLVVKKQAVIVEINSKEDLDALCKAFPRPGGGFSYESLASAGVDGVRLTQDGVRASKRASLDDPMHNFSSWDLDSTVWINKDSISTRKPVAKASYPKPEPDEYDRYDVYGDDEDDNTQSIDELLGEMRANNVKNGFDDPSQTIEEMFAEFYADPANREDGVTA